MTSRISQFLRNGLLSLTARDLLLFVPLAALTVIAAGFAASRLRTRKPESVAYSRKTFHFIVFTAAGLFQLGLGLKMTVVFGTVASAAVVIAVLRGAGHPLYDALARPKDRPRESLFILAPLVSTALGGVLSNVWFPRTAVIGYMVTGWADAAAEPVGAAWGRHRYRVPSLFGVSAARSVEGSAAVLAAAFAAVLLCGRTMGLGCADAVRMASACAAAAALVEAASHHGLDNLTVQVAVSAVAALFL
jgi:phytol kinase